MQFNLTFSSMADTIQSLRKASAQVKEELGAMEKQVEAGLESWQGGARQAYFQHKAEWNKAAARMPEKVDHAEKVLAKITSNYQNAEQTGVRIWQSQ